MFDRLRGAFRVVPTVTCDPTSRKLAVETTARQLVTPTTPRTATPTRRRAAMTSTPTAKTTTTTRTTTRCAPPTRPTDRIAPSRCCGAASPRCSLRRRMYLPLCTRSTTNVRSILARPVSHSPHEDSSCAGPSHRRRSPSPLCRSGRRRRHSTVTLAQPRHLSRRPVRHRPAVHSVVRRLVTRLRGNHLCRWSLACTTDDWWTTPGAVTALSSL